MKKVAIIIAVLLIVLLITIGIVVKVLLTPGANTANQRNPEIKNEIVLVPLADSIKIDTSKSKQKADTVIVSIAGLNGKMTSIGYELTYDSKGLIKGVNSGSKPLDVTGKDSFEREVYLGTCSKNVCKPDAGVTKVSVALDFLYPDGSKSQFSKDYDL